jgi:hypothetical protein
MKKFLALYMAPAASIQEMMKNASKEDMKKGLDDWMNWAAKHKDVITDMGNPIGKNMRVLKDGSSMVSNEVCGYSMLSADSHEAASKIFADCPHYDLKGAYVEVMECMQM